MKRIFALAGGLAVFALAGGCNSGSGTEDNSTTGGTTKTTKTTSTGKDLKIAMIPKGTTNVYWKSCQYGALQAAKELGITLQWKGPIKENDRSQEIAIVKDFTSQKVDGIVVAPLDNVALAPSIKDATSGSIPVVLFDSGLSATKATAGKDYVALVATDNVKGGKLGGERLAKLLGGKGKVVLLRCLVGSASTEDREKGFLAAMDQNPGITVTVKDVYGGATVEDAKRKALELMDKVTEADGIFASNESTTTGMLLALRQNSLTGKKKFVGFDTSPTLLDALKAKEIDALVSQDPKKMGYQAVKTLVDHIRGQKVPTNMDTGVIVVDNDNISKPDVQKVISPPPATAKF